MVLQTQEYQNRNTQEQSIYMSFNRIDVFLESYPSDFVEHYYELVMSYNLLFYLKRNYEISYEKEFKEFENYLEIITENTNSYIRDSGYKKIELNKQLKIGEISTRILETWRTNFNIKKLTLLIDRFDWTNNKDELSQKILQRYFYLFNKIVITTDSENINYESLEKKGYSLLEVDYGKK